MRPGSEVVVAIAVRDPAGTNYSPYTFPNPSLAQVGITQPLNKPVLDHIDVIRGLVTGYKTAGRGRLRRPVAERPGSTNPDLATVPAAAKNTSARDRAHVQQRHVEAPRTATAVQGDGVPHPRRERQSQYLRLRGTNLPAVACRSRPMPTAIRWRTSGPTRRRSTRRCRAARTAVPGECEPAHSVHDGGHERSGHRGTLHGNGDRRLPGAPAGGQRPEVSSAYDVAAWSDLWFYSNPIFIEVKGSSLVAGVEVTHAYQSGEPMSAARQRAALSLILKRERHMSTVLRIQLRVFDTASAACAHPALAARAAAAFRRARRACCSASITSSPSRDRRSAHHRRRCRGRRRRRSQVFKQARGREPERRRAATRCARVWLDNEVLYREGLALGLDKGDTAIRERVIFKALSMVDASVKLPAFDEADAARVVREAIARKYDEPARFDFRGSRARGRTLGSRGARVRQRAELPARPAMSQAGLRVFTARPHDNIVQSYGAEFAAALEASPPGEWRALPSQEGLRAMRLKSIDAREARRVRGRCAASCCRTGRMR